LTLEDLTDRLSRSYGH